MTSLLNTRTFQYDLPAHPSRPNAGTPFREYRRLSDGRLITNESFESDPEFADEWADLIFGSDLFIERVSAEFPVERVEGDLGVFGVLLFAIDMGKTKATPEAIAARSDALANEVGFDVR